MMGYFEELVISGSFAFGRMGIGKRLARNFAVLFFFTMDSVAFADVS